MTPTRSLLHVAPPLAALALGACGTEAGDPELLLPDEVRVEWAELYNGTDDGLGALVPVDVMAYDGATGEPLADVPIEVWTDDASAFPLPVEAVLVISPPSEGEPREEEPAPAPDEPESSSDEPASSDEPVEAPESHDVRWIAWDAARDQYVTLDPEVHPVDEDGNPLGSGIELRTDSGGVARLYLYVDAFPTTSRGGEGAQARAGVIRVVVSMGGVDGLFTVAPR